eukprot:m51a1_g7597 hypothetical protein (172) ;mRNA; r:227990-228595
MKAGRRHQCPVCLETIKVLGALDSCSHEFCLECMLHWSSLCSYCPLCKLPFHKRLKGLVGKPLEVKQKRYEYEWTAEELLSLVVENEGDAGRPEEPGAAEEDAEKDMVTRADGSVVSSRDLVEAALRGGDSDIEEDEYPDDDDEDDPQVQTMAVQAEHEQSALPAAFRSFF